MMLLVAGLTGCLVSGIRYSRSIAFILASFQTFKCIHKLVLVHATAATAVALDVISLKQYLTIQRMKL